MRSRRVRFWRWTRRSVLRRVSTAVAVGVAAAVVVLSFDVRARVEGDMTYCGNGLIGTHVPLFDDPPPSFFEECDDAIRRWRAGAAVVGVTVGGAAAVVGEVAARRRRG